MLQTRYIFVPETNFFLTLCWKTVKRQALSSDVFGRLHSGAANVDFDADGENDGDLHDQKMR